MDKVGLEGGLASLDVVLRAPVEVRLLESPTCVRALPTETKIESGTSPSKSGTSVNFQWKCAWWVRKVHLALSCHRWPSTSGSAPGREIDIRYS